MPYGSISPQEALRLKALRERFCGQPEYLELDISERRLQFARWLVEHGRLDEFPKYVAEIAAAHPEGAPQKEEGFAQEESQEEFRLAALEHARI